jgi:gamma-glutamyltranspeptidase/glutathione hydrolase
VVDAAVAMLKGEGNAFDAVVAAAFASAVVEPALTSLGGGGFLLARTAANSPVLFDFFVDTPGRGLSEPPAEPPLVPITVEFPGVSQVFHAGAGSIAVPGNLRGFLHVHRRLGRLPLPTVLAPAIELATRGAPVNAAQAYTLGLLVPIMTMRPEGRALFAPGGEYLSEGSTYANRPLAEFLSTVASDGDRSFYEGAIAARLVRAVAAEGGILTAEDLAAYRVIERTPLRTEYRGNTLFTNPEPSFGGGLLSLSLAFLDACDLAAFGRGSEGHLTSLAAAMQEVDRQRAHGLLRPADLSASQLAEARGRVRRATGGTTHISVCDADGNAASLTMSNGEGSGCFVPGTGIMLNNMMGEDDLHPDGFHAGPAGQRVASMMSPSLLLERDGVRLVLGSGGSKRIRTALLQVICNVVDFGLDVGTAVDAPRLHWDGDAIQVEPGYRRDAVDALAARWPVNRWDRTDLYFGGVHAVAPSGAAAGDPRRGGCALVL